MRIVRDVVRVQGSDAASFLQGQLSQDVEGLAVGALAWSLILQPQGKVDALVRVSRAGDDELVIDVDAGFGDAVIARLDRFKLRVKATLGPAEPRTFEVGEDGVPSPAPADAVADAEWQAAWDRRRVELGVPAMGHELTEDTIPEEAGIVDAAVSFTKGCYTGQELVARIDSRGRNVPRRLRRIVLEADGELHDGDELTSDGKVVGTVTTAAGGQALGYASRAVDVGSVVTTRAGVARIEAVPPLR